jgi:hypothetical protein
MSDDFYVRYYVGHKGKFGHEYLEFEFRQDGKVRLPAAPGAARGPRPARIVPSLRPSPRP